MSPLQAALILAATTGFVAGKLDLDTKIRDAIRAQNLRMAQMNARTLVDELESRKLGFPIVKVPADAKA